MAQPRNNHSRTDRQSQGGIFSTSNRLGRDGCADKRSPMSAAGLSGFSEGVCDMVSGKCGRSWTIKVKTHGKYLIFLALILGSW